mmetsp:Transcript_1674/g.2320  ORF Transcript_1674/g.2320 Transcript_1674/m.2320 type:complete len:573 (+) Transcript_1674:123-1841(+)
MKRLFFHVITSCFFFVITAAQQCIDPDATASCSNSSNNQTFFAWDVAQAPPFLSGLFPNNTLLQSAWETHPLLSKVSFAHHHQQQSQSDQSIPSILHDRSAILKLQSEKEEGDPLLSLLTVDDTISIISRPFMRHGVDYKLAKKIVQNGEEHLGILPKSHYSIDEIRAHFRYGGFSVVIDRMQRRWAAIARQASRLEEELKSIKVGVNMYLTPEVVLESEKDKRNGHTRQGFEPHWDWMDVIIIQIAGRKRWSVANEPTIYLSNRDQKRKPTIEEIKHYVQSPARFSEFTLCPGDALYVPRGHIHNASTVLVDGDASNEPLNKCPASYPSAEIQQLLNWKGQSSLHLTFGFEQSCEGTLESLLHHALNLYFNDNRSFNSIALPAETCSSRNQAAKSHDIKWRAVLHHALATVARKRHPCDFPSFHGSDAKQKDCNGNASLRRSLPLGLSGKSESVQYSNLKHAFLQALDIFVSSASIVATAEFVQSLQKPPADPELFFCFPEYTVEDVVACSDALMLLREHEFNEVLMDFHEKASSNFHEALKVMDKFGNGMREMNRKQQLDDLKRVAQVNV